MKILLTAINAKYIHSNLAIYNLRSYALGYVKDMQPEDIELAEYTINQKVGDILSDLYKRKPAVLCFSCYIWNIEYVREVAAEFHKICPDVPIWLGGPEVSYEATTFLKENPYVTGIMMGEGEQIFAELCRLFSKSLLSETWNYADILGIAYRTDQGICQNSPAEPLDMSTIPFSYHDEVSPPHSRKKCSAESLKDFKNRIIYYETSRGCPFNCSYCLSSVDKHLRFRDLTLVKQELAFFMENEVPQVKFVDRTFNCNHDHAMAIWKFIKEHDRGITNFHFEVAADLLTEEEIAYINTMRPGLIQLEIGVQSTHEPTITEIHRRMDLARVKQVVQAVKEPGNIHQHLDLIAGLPYEDEVAFAHSFDTIYALKPEQLQLGFLKVLKGSYMYDHASEYELLYMTRPPYEVLQTKWLSYEAILQIKLVEEMLEVYYNSGQYGKSITLLEECFTSAFTMFYELGRFYEENDLLGCSHTRIRRLEIFLEFAGQVDSNYLEAYREAAIYDLYKRENAKSRPAFAADLQEWKLLTRSHCKKGKLSHVERFWYEGKNKQSEPYYLLFDYERRSPLDHQAWEERI